MSELTIFDTSGEAYSARLVDGVPEIEFFGGSPYPVFPFQAIVRRSYGFFWILNGWRHRQDGPAYERANGSKAWYVNGNLHRLDGPAMEYADGYKFWYINGRKLSEDEFNGRVSLL